MAALSFHWVRGDHGSGGHACLPCLDAAGQSDRAGPRVSERVTSFPLIVPISTCRLTADTGTDLCPDQRLSSLPNLPYDYSCLNNVAHR